MPETVLVGGEFKFVFCTNNIAANGADKGLNTPKFDVSNWRNFLYVMQYHSMVDKKWAKNTMRLYHMPYKKFNEMDTSNYSQLTYFADYYR